MNETRKVLLAGAAVAALGLGWAPLAQAILVNDVNDDFSITWNLPANTSDNDGGSSTIPLTATANFDVTAVSPTSVTLVVKVTNTTQLTKAITEAGITTFGIGVSPDATKVTFTDIADNGFVNAQIDTNGNFPGGFHEIDLCVFTDGCSGGAQGSALPAGQTPAASDTFTLVIEGNFTSGVTLDPFPVKFQTTAGSFEFAGTTGLPPSEVPEPGSLALLGAGMFALWGLRRKRNA